MEDAYNNCLEKNQLKKVDPIRHIAEKELREALYDLETARKDNEDHKWTIIEAYYSCFHAARCLLFLIGLKERSHFCVYAALKFVFNEYFTHDELEGYKNQMDRRESADYYSSYSKEEAEAAVEFAENFIEKVKTIHKKLKDLDLESLKKIRDK